MKALAYNQIAQVPGIPFTVQQILLALTLSYWNPVTGAWQSPVPSFARGLQGGVRFRVQNNTAYSLYIRGETSIRRPDGTTFSLVGVSKLVSAGASSDWDFLFTTDQAGTWQHNVAVYSGLFSDAMSMTLSQGWTNAAFAQVAAAGTITMYEFQNPATGAWQAAAPMLYIGQTLNLRGHGRNDSGASMRARMDVIFWDPDNKIRNQVNNPQGVPVSQIGAVATQAASGAAQQGTWTFSIDLDAGGTWHVTLILFGELA